MNNFSELGLSEIWPLMEEQIKEGKSVKFKPGGTSMMPLIRPEKDVVLIKKAPDKLKKFDVTLYRRESGQFVLHRVIKVRNGVYTMRGDNQNRLEKGVKPEQILAIAEGVYKDDEYFSFSGVKYWIYCYFRHFRLEFSRFRRILKNFAKKHKKVSKKY